MKQFLEALTQFFRSSRSIEDFEVLKQQFETTLYGKVSKDVAKTEPVLRRQIAIGSLALHAAWPYAKDEEIRILASTLRVVEKDGAPPQDLIQVRELFAANVCRFTPIFNTLSKAA